MFDIGKAIGGPDEGDGIVGWMLGMFGIGGLIAGGAGSIGGGVADDIAGHGVADGFGTASRAAATGAETAAGFGRAATAGEGVFSRIFASFRYWTPTDWYVFTDFLSGGAREKFLTLSEKAKAVASAHGFMLQQLKVHQDKEGIAALLGEYEQLGAQLPSEDLLQKVHRALAKFMHPKKAGDSEALATLLNTSRDALKDRALRMEYEAACQVNLDAVNEVINGFASAENSKWEAAAEEIIRKERASPKLLLTDSKGTGGTEAAEKGFLGGLSHGQKNALIFGAIAAVGIGAYLAVKKIGKNKNKHPEQQRLMGHLPVAVAEIKPAHLNERESDKVVNAR